MRDAFGTVAYGFFPMQTMDAETATTFARALIDRGDTSIVMAIASILSGWLEANAQKAAA